MGVPVVIGLGDCSKIGIRGVLGLEAAAGYWGMSTFDYLDFPIFLFEADKVIDLRDNISFVGIPRDLSNSCNVDISEQFGEGLFVTNKLQTICDMIICDCDLFHLLETIDDFYTFESDSSISELEKLAEQQGVLHRLKELYEMSLDSFEED